ncbi:hypothetical protein [Pseudodesulfovibrio sediminis]|uniref:Lipoprotein n=1 Tax=Pseudodesulfovibrio sediminis TaxID=2810563 RepID=A0ABM7P9R8_9BACT|nr:hypothetical protein [Pseudodesulfovibrio sediminis]BCS90161.1 lipoprotein [Pseudodesulfovibrio sediminis]
MKRGPLYFGLIVFCLALLSLAGCGKSTRNAAVPRPEGKLAVAGFTNPTRNWELLAGYLDEEGKPAPEGTVETLDMILADTLRKHQVFDYITPPAVEHCEDVVVFEDGGLPKLSAWKYWLGVAKCMDVDYLLVPQLTTWRERVGSAGGVESPASVAIDFYLISVKEERMIRSRYEETQQALLDNLFEAGKFADRGGKWVTATRLASDGIEEKLMELGL